MNSLRLSLVPGLIAGLISVFTSWFWIGFVFHKHQRATPQTWRNETAGHHVLSSLIQIAASVAIATLYLMVTRTNAGVVTAGMSGAINLAVIGWIAFTAPVLLNQVLYVNMRPLFAVGLLVSWLTTSLLACCLTWWWLSRA
jgi:hypothetical protein